MNHTFDHHDMCRYAVQDFIDEYEERRYKRALLIEKWTRGLIKAREPEYLWNGGWY